MGSSGLQNLETGTRATTRHILTVSYSKGCLVVLKAGRHVVTLSHQKGGRKARSSEPERGSKPNDDATKAEPG